ncbi:DUF6339 family protein [Marinobacterium stanieri]|uniref:DUF6339 family protein n=1 Tax=Marinobacterium stanieri TaxID=49186 RepID=UPI0002558C1B|nr:DUF6339 family protein [Marinobacterium stanieri]
MPTLKILPYKQIGLMRKRVESSSSMQMVYAQENRYELPSEVESLDTLIELPESPPELNVSNSRTKDDADNAIKVYEYLGPLQRTQAADTRLWTTLTHTTFWNYCQQRWPDAQRHGASYILEHWFEKKGGGLGALRRNAISRLWWAAHLTVAPWEKDSELLLFKSSDRYRLTKTLLSQAQIFQDVLEREYGSNIRIRTIILNSLEKYLPNVRSRDDLSKEVSTKLLLMLKNRHLAALGIEESNEVIEALVKRVAEGMPIKQ